MWAWYDVVSKVTRFFCVPAAEDSSMSVTERFVNVGHLRPHNRQRFQQRLPCDTPVVLVKVCPLFHEILASVNGGHYHQTLPTCCSDVERTLPHKRRIASAPVLSLSLVLLV